MKFGHEHIILPLVWVLATDSDPHASFQEQIHTNTAGVLVRQRLWSEWARIINGYNNRIHLWWRAWLCTQN